MIRKSLLTLTLVFLFVLAILFNGWNLFNLNDYLKNALVTQLHSLIGDECTIERLSLRVGSINLEGVKFAFQNSPYELEIEELRLGYSLTSLVRGAIDLEKSAEKITIHRPRLVLKYSSKKDIKPDVPLSLNLSNEAEKTYRTFIKDSNFIKKIIVTEGEITLLDASTHRQVDFAKNINGWVSTDNNGQAWLRMAGNIFQTEEPNMVLYGQVDFNRGGIKAINLDLRDYKIGNELPFLLPNYFEVLSGDVSGHFQVTERTEPTRGFNIEGDVELKAGQMKLKSENLFIDDIYVSAHLKDWNLEIKQAHQLVNGSRVKVEGQIRNVLNPYFDLRVSSAELDLNEFMTKFLPKQKFPFAGHANLDFSITDDIQNPNIQGSLMSDSLAFHTRMLRDVAVDFSFSEKSLMFRKIKGSIGEASMIGTGNIDFGSSEKITSLEFDVNGNLSGELYDLGLVSADNGVGTARVKVFGPIENLVSRGNFSLGFTNDSAQELSFEGFFRYTNGDGFVSASSSDNEFRLNASIDSVFTKPYFRVEANRLEKLFVFVDDARLDFIRNRFNLRLHAEGGKKEIQSTIKGYRNENYQKVFEITSQLKLAETLQGDITLYPTSHESITGQFAADLTDKFKLTQLELGDWLRGEFDTGDTKVPWDARFTLSGFKLSSLLALLGKQDLRFDGDIVGQITYIDDEQKPQYNGNLWLLNGFLNDLGPIKGEMAFEADDEKIAIKSVSFESEDLLSLKGVGVYNYDTGRLWGSVAGSNVHVEDVLTLFTRQKNVVQGNAFLQVSFDGKFPKIPLYGTVTVHDARILMLAFDKIKLAFGNETHDTGSYFSKDMLHLGNATVEKQDEFVLQGSAQLPLNDHRPMDLQMSGDGNFLALLPDLAEIFQTPKSAGHLDLSLAGLYQTPNFTGSRLRVKNGSLQLGTVAKNIRNLEADLEVVEDDHFLDIKKLNATIQGKRFSISNTRAFPDSSKIVFEPLRLGGNNLNLGALRLQTGEDGIPLNIPGLMAKGDVGLYSFVGKPDTSDVGFIIAGPWLRPQLHGTVQVRNANVMFPFDENAGEGHPIVQNIINNIDWDVTAVSQQDTRYVRRYAAGVYVNAEVDKKNSKLNFSGILKDSTFMIDGKVESTRGEFEYFDLKFRIEKFGAEFNHGSLYPDVFGKAWTVVRDTSNVPSDVYLTLVTVDDLNREVNKGRWDRINIKLSSEHPTFEETQGDLMAALGYSSTTIDKQARKAVGYSTDSFIFRPLMRPLERQLERSLGLDVVRFSYAFTQNFLDSNFSNEQLRSSLQYLRSSRLILGKYLTEDIYLLYTGELASGIDFQYQDKGVGLQHILGLEYRLSRNWLLQMEYDYNTLLEAHKDDKKFSLRHSFPF